MPSMIESRKFGFMNKMYGTIILPVILYRCNNWPLHQGMRSMRLCSWLRHCAASQEVMGSIPDGVIGIFH